MNRLMVISADCHAGLPTAEYHAYLEKRYHGPLNEFVEKREAAGRSKKWMESEAFSKESFDQMSKQAAFQSGGVTGVWDADRRLRENEADGIAAEVIFSDFTQDNTPPFDSNEYPVQMRIAGVRAYNRWLAELCSAAPGRMAGVLELSGFVDVDEMVEEIRWGARAGLRGIMFPSASQADSAGHLYHERYDPVWAACVEFGLPVHSHVGWGKPAFDLMDAGGRTLYAFECRWWARRPLWFLIFGGVLERFPQLRLVFTELRADWVPSTLVQMDYRYDDVLLGHATRSALPNRPREYWHRQCALGASSMSRAEVLMRHDIGIETMMFGTDYPHFEGTWPNTKAWLARAFEGIPEQDARAILGLNAARIYDFDTGELQAIANRIGPTVDDIVNGAAAGDDETARWVAERGVDRPAFGG